MVNNNLNNIVKVEEIREINNEVPSYEEFLKTWKKDERVSASYESEINAYGELGKGYGPCPDGCSSGDYLKRNQHLISTLNNKCGKKFEVKVDGSIEKYDDGWSMGRLQNSGEASAGLGGVITDVEHNFSVARYSGPDGDVRLVSGSFGAEAGIGLGGATLGYSASFDVASMHTGGFRINAGVDGGSGFTSGEGGVGAKVAGFGFSVGKRMGVSTPFGGVSIDLEESCNQQ